MISQSNRNIKHLFCVEKRAFNRISTKIDTRLFIGNIFYSGTVLNLSDNGMFIKTKKLLPSDSMFVVIIRDDDGLLNVIVKVKQVLTHTDTYSGMGVELINPFSGYLDFVHGLCVPSSRNLS